MRDGQKVVILGIGDDGLAGLTEPARRLMKSADLILGASVDPVAAGGGAGAKGSRWSRT